MPLISFLEPWLLNYQVNSVSLRLLLRQVWEQDGLSEVEVLNKLEAGV